MSSNVPVSLAEMAKHLGTSAEEVLRLPPELLHEAMREMGWSAAQKARFYVENRPANAHPTSTTEALREYFEKAERRGLQRWRATAEKLEAERNVLWRETEVQQRLMFVDRAKASLLYPEDVITGTYLLFGDDAARRFYAGVLLRKTGLDRVVAHNFFVSSKLDESFVNIHGDRLVDFAWPLFPPDANFAALNEKLLSETNEPSGGGRQVNRPSVFRPASGEGAGYTAPVLMDGNGQQYVDLSEIESAYLTLQQAVAASRQPRQDATQRSQNISQRGRGSGRGTGSRRGGRARGGGIEPGTCFTCGGRGHKANQCPSSASEQPKTTQSSPQKAPTASQGAVDPNGGF